MPFWRSFWSFFAVRKKFRFLRVFLVWGLRGAVQEVLGRETLENKGFRSNFALWCLVHLRWTRCIALMLHKCFENNFWGSYKFVFSEVRIFDKIGFGRQKTAWGCRTEDVLKMTFFPFFLGRVQFVKFLARFRRAAVSRFGFESAVARNLLAAVRMVFPSFPRLFFRHRFCEFEKGSFETPLSSFRVLLFSAFSSWVWVDATLHVCFGAVGPKPFISFFCLSVYKIFVFPVKKGYFCSFLRVFLSFSLASFTSPFHSLSLSFSCFFLFILPCSFVSFCDLPCFFAVLSCLVSLLLFHDNNNIKILDVKVFFSSIISVSFGFPVLLSLQSFFLSLFFII